MIYKLGDICTITKGETGIMKAIPGEYAMITLGEENKTHNEYQFDAKAVIVQLVSTTGHGHASMKRVKYFEGKFALGTILCALIPKDETKVNAKYLQIYLHENRERLLVSLMKGAANVSLPIKRLDNVEVVIPSMKIQLEIVEFEKFISNKRLQFSNEYVIQTQLLSQFRQSILQEAIQGKLTAEWRSQNPNTEPAAELLKRIKAEKEKLVKEKKIKQEKPLPAINENEIPFELPEGWVWCRLGEICNRIHHGYNASAKPEKRDVRLLRITDIQENQVNWDIVPGCDYTLSDLENYLLDKNDIVIARTGGTIGKTFLVQDIPVKSLFASYLIRAIPSKEIFARYLKSFMESPTYWQKLYDAAWGAGQPNVNGTSLSYLVVSLPPLSEQQAIVAKVEALLGKCSQLQVEIEKLNAFSKDLLKALFYEIF